MQGYGWWKEEGENAAQCLFEEIKKINSNDSPRLNALLRYLRMYTGRDNVNLATMDVINRLQIKNDAAKVVEKDLNYNVVQSAINTLASKLCKREERVRFLTNGGSWESQRQAQRADRFMFGLFKAAKIHEVNKHQSIDSYWSGSGFGQIHHRIRNGKIEICYDRIHPAEIVVDQSEAETTKPQTMRRVRAVDKEIVYKRFPDAKAQLDLLTMRSSNGYDSITGKVLVAESWHLPDDNGEGGKHILACQNCVLFEEEYHAFHFPIIKQDYIWAPFGYYGIGIAELLQTHQRELDNLVRFRQSNLKRGAMARTYVDRTAKVSVSKLSNRANEIIEYNGVRPVQEAAPAYADQLARDIQEIFQKAYNEVGISELAATSRKPEGLDSGKALREFSDIESERFQMAGQARQEAHLDIARAALREVELIKKLKKTNPAYKSASSKFISYDKEQGVEQFDLTELDLAENEYIIQKWATSMLPEKPEGQLQFAEELASVGFIAPDEALELLDFPDSQPVINRKLAGYRYARAMIEKMLDDGEYVPPDPYENHQKNYEVAKEYYLLAKLHNYDEEKLSLLRQYMDDNISQIRKKQVEEMAMQAQAQAQAQPQMPMEQAQLPQ